MKTILQISRLVAVVATVLLDSASARPQNTVSEPQNAAMIEVLELRADILQFLLIAEQGTVRTLKHELDQLERQEQRIEDEDAGRNRQLADIEKQLSSPDLEADARPQVEAIRQQLDSVLAAKLRSEREALHAHKADVTAKLHVELQQEQALQWRAALVRKALGR